jgi:hypothetical protein
LLVAAVPVMMLVLVEVALLLFVVLTLPGSQRAATIGWIEGFQSRYWYWCLR